MISLWNHKPAARPAIMATLAHALQAGEIKPAAYATTIVEHWGHSEFTGLWAAANELAIAQGLAHAERQQPGVCRAAMRSCAKRFPDVRHDVRVFDALPSVVTLYRGCTGRDRLGAAWSLNRTVARNFPANHHYGLNGPTTLLTARVPRSQIAFYTNERSEQECVLLCPDAVPQLELVAEQTYVLPAMYDSAEFDHLREQMIDRQRAYGAGP